jgi:hypothetical protein
MGSVTIIRHAAADFAVAKVPHHRIEPLSIRLPGAEIQRPVEVLINKRMVCPRPKNTAVAYPLRIC